MNLFNIELEEAIVTGQYISYPNSQVFNNANSVIIEVSSLQHNIYAPTRSAVHANPNFDGCYTYKDIYPDGYYRKFRPDLPVETYIAEEGEIVKLIEDLGDVANGRRLLILGHLADDTPKTKSRTRLNSLLKMAADECDVEYFDTLPFVKKFGFSMSNGLVDIHHLSDLGVAAIGLALQEALAGK